MQEPESKPPRRTNKKAFWAKQFVLWHWVSSAICLVAVLFFAVTGITLNHAATLKAKPSVQERNGVLPAALVTAISQSSDEADDMALLPSEVAKWLRDELKVNVDDRNPEWSADEIYISLPRPGGDAWLTIDRQSGDVDHEITSQGLIAYFNDLHKGRNTGAAWFWFIDIFSIACVAFSLTGLGLLWVHAKRRPSTWPLVVAGLFIPVAIVVLFVH